MMDNKEEERDEWLNRNSTVDVFSSRRVARHVSMTQSTNVTATATRRDSDGNHSYIYMYAKYQKRK